LNALSFLLLVLSFLLLGLFHDIKAKGFVSNETTYHILIRLFLDINSVSEAVLSIKEAEEKGMIPKYRV
jgi:hypothetical protein